MPMSVDISWTTYKVQTEYTTLNAGKRTEYSTCTIEYKTQNTRTRRAARLSMVQLTSTLA